MSSAELIDPQRLIHEWANVYAKHTHYTVQSVHITATTITFNGPCSGLPGWAGTRKVKPIWILLKQETVSGNDISWAICKFAPHYRQITMPAPHHSVFYRPDALPAAQPTASKHWRHCTLLQRRLISQWQRARLTEDGYDCCNAEINVEKHPVTQQRVFLHQTCIACVTQ